MCRVYAVLGANYGDEGKGLATDYLSWLLRDRGEDVVVVRSNGGAQAGHTVHRSDGASHVFHHIGSGTLSGARTHLSRHFVHNPLRLIEELGEYRALGRNHIGVRQPVITADPAGYVTTPYDMILNQWLERWRRGYHGEKGVHGSCGLGFGETIERNEHGMELRISDFYGKTAEELERFMRLIEREWVPYRWKEMTGKSIEDFPDYARLFYDLNAAPWAEMFVGYREHFASRVEVLGDENLLTLGAPIFEGAQGLGLDQDLGHWPHVTRSATGLRNVLDLCQRAGVTDLDVTYVTRTYLTRHGRGPMDAPAGFEAVDCGIDIVDETNVHGEWQDSIRVQPLNVDVTAHRIRTDLGLEYGSGVVVTPHLMITHADLSGPLFGIIHNEEFEEVTLQDLGDSMLALVPELSTINYAYGKCCEDVHPHRVEGLSEEAPAASVPVR